MSETYNAYRWAFIRMILRHDWSIIELRSILGYMTSVVYERQAISQSKTEEWKEAHRQALKTEWEELEKMMKAHALSPQERNIIRKLVSWQE